MSTVLRVYKPMALMGLLMCAGWSTGALALGIKELSAEAQALVEKDDGTGTVRTRDEVVMKDGQKHVGDLKPSDDRAVILIKKGNSTAPLQVSDVKLIRLKLSPETKLENIIDSNGDNIRVMIEKLRDYEKETRGYDEKVSQKLEAIAVTKPDLDLFLFLAERYLALGKPEKAETVARKATEKDPRQPNAWYYLGMALLKQGKSAEAAQALNKAKTLAPGDVKIQVALSSIVDATSTSDDARKKLEDIVAANPQQIDAWISLGKLLLQDGEIELAGQKFEQALKIDAESRQSIIGLAACKIMTKDYEGGWKTADRLSLINTRVENLMPRANALQAYAKLMTPSTDIAVMEADLNKAQDKIQQALKEELNDPRFKVIQYRIFLRAAEVAEKQGKSADYTARKEDAARVLNELEVLDPAKLNDNVVVFWLAERQLRKGDPEKALPGFKRLIQLSPNYAPGHQALGSALLKMRKWDEAMQAFEKAYSLDKTLADAQAGSGLALLGKKDLAGAKERLKSALDLDPQQVPALCGMGYIANFEGNELRARELFHQALAIDGTCTYAAEALKKIYEQRELLLQYLDFTDPQANPSGWAGKGSAPLRPVVGNGTLNWNGTPIGAVTMQKFEYACPVNGDGFKRVEADLKISPTSGSSLALRVASRTGSSSTFELEFGKDPSGKVGYRVRDYGGAAMEWKQLPKPLDWPENGKARLAIESADLPHGDITLYFNGKNVGHMTLQVKNPTRIAAGVSLQPGANEVVEASADNLVLLYKKGADRSPVNMGGTELKAPDEKPEGGENKPAGDDKGANGAK